jgi:peptidoglycan hydrolase-like protein with peptidoglycan-binding domain
MCTRGRRRPRLGATVGITVALVLGLGLAACNDSSASSARTPPSTTRAAAETSTTEAPTTTTTTVAPTTTTTPPAPPPAPTVLRRGDTGALVALVQLRLTELGFRPGPVNGTYGDATYAAAMAFQKHEGLDADGHTGPITLAALKAGMQGAGPRGGPAPRIEVDVKRQIAFVVAAGGTTKIVNVSTGSGRRYSRPQGGTAFADTPTGNFSIKRRINGVHVAPLGKMYRPMYFQSGFAIHGSSNVPGFPASHGCVRTTNPDQDYIWSTIPNGAAVHIYDA